MAGYDTRLDRRGRRLAAAPTLDCGTTPWEEPIVGPDAIVEDWLGDRDEAGTYESHYEPWAVVGSRAVGVGTSTYRVEGGLRVFHNAFLLEFDDQGACRSFTDIYLEQP